MVYLFNIKSPPNHPTQYNPQLPIAPAITDIIKTKAKFPSPFEDKTPISGNIIPAGNPGKFKIF